MTHEIGFLFKGAMATAIHDDRKRQTRRPADLSPDVAAALADVKSSEGWTLQLGPDARGVFWRPLDNGRLTLPVRARCAPGDRIWVRETWQVVTGSQNGDLAAMVRYRDGHTRPCWMPADKSLPLGLTWDHWRPSLHMPRWAARSVRLVTEVRLQRLWEITEYDALAEGVTTGRIPADEEGPERIGYVLGSDDGKCLLYPTAYKAFSSGWDRINGKQAPWAENSWVWVYSFERDS